MELNISASCQFLVIFSSSFLFFCFLFFVFCFFLSFLSKQKEDNRRIQLTSFAKSDRKAGRMCLGSITSNGGKTKSSNKGLRSAAMDSSEKRLEAVSGSWNQPASRQSDSSKVWLSGLLEAFHSNSYKRLMFCETAASLRHF